MNLLPYLGPWCCEKGRALGVQVCPGCKKTNDGYQACLGVDALPPRWEIWNSNWVAKIN